MQKAPESRARPPRHHEKRTRKRRADICAPLRRLMDGYPGVMPAELEIAVADAKE